MTADRVDVRFPSGGIECAAWFYQGAAGAPVVVMGHGLGGVKEMRLDAFAEKFAAQGYSCLVFDYRHFGGSDGEPRQLLDIDEQLEDWAAAIAFARTRAEKIVLWGTSFGGGHVIVAAARDGHVDAVISQCPFTDGIASALATNPLVAVRVTARALRDKLGSALGRAPRTIPLAGKPGATALMSSEDALDGYLALLPSGAPFRNEVLARVGLDIPLRRPGRHASNVTCPILFTVCETDTVAPAKATLRHAARAPRGEVMSYPDGHFAIYVGDAFERVVADQIAFLQRVVPV
ncbi:alpha/beta hydrolase [Rhodococcus sp. 15-649-1-2]|uniref:alpha/beta hydrolase n=1 Tax=Nocardiaceae TaxID=85025 RepID=UPI00036538D6|nr:MULTISPECIES: alpha/beta fold hydrolase [Rhodococcus]OZC79245.1 alpha/beta hydrolase [Rhodococcus sp. 06-418-1B]OZD15042.1 alpha/beta hydrolase [Rhodococcus sp. 06-156-4C]OZD19873.1 alpha/beta hydrolase [Rhodococcus sp. 06-156-4a]OZD22819.1 alpha/beta hydrolase [Rhodococcus sp. 06-156-3C]OZD25890.1 alpha/beta hydrolase [Rhodococcus sp. 06-156-3b]